MSTLLSRRQLGQLAFAVGAAGCGGEANRPSPTSGPPALESAKTAKPADFNEPPKSGPPAELLKAAIFMGGEAHPTRPLFATASQIWGGDDNGGQLIVWDLLQGQPVSVYTDTESGFVFSGDPGMVRWAPNGDRIAASFDTNGILVLENGRPLIGFFPDDGRDHEVSFSWLDGSRLYTDTGHIATVPSVGRVAVDTRSHYDGYERIFTGGKKQPIDPLLQPASGLPELATPFRKNSAISAMVGASWDRLFLNAFQISTLTPLFHVPLYPTRPNRKDVDEFSLYIERAAWSADGRRLAIPWHHLTRQGNKFLGEREGFIVVDADTGRELHNVTLGKGEGSLRALRWSPRVGDSYRLAVITGRGAETIRLHVFDGAQVAWSADVRLAYSNFNIRDAQSINWSPNGEALVMPWRDGALRILEASTGKLRATLATGIKASGKEHSGLELGVMWAQGDRLIAWNDSNLMFMTLTGERVAHHRVPI